LPDPQSDMPVELSERISASDAALAARVACGDAAALTPLYQRHRGAVYRFALLWSGAPAMAADVTQDVFLHLLGHADDYDPGRGPLLPWLLGITRNFVHRRAGVDARYVPEEENLEFVEMAEPAQDEAIDSQRALDRLRSAIAALPPHYRDVLVLVELAERSYAEAAAICGCELNTVRSRLFRARALVAQTLRAAPDNVCIARG
jgi:RNA polymerase sigma-70 factor (ECF subfamily)